MSARRAIGRNEKNPITTVEFDMAQGISSVRDTSNSGQSLLTSSATQSDQARREMESLPHEPFWLCQWRDVVFLHLEAEADLLQRAVPFELDLFEGRAFVTLVAFTLRDMRPRLGGAISRALFKPLGTHQFLNVRAYVRHEDQRGIFFIAEYLDAPWLNHLAGPLLYGLPFHVAELDYRHEEEECNVSGTVTGRHGVLAYEGRRTNSQHGFDSSADHDPRLTEFLLERYRAFTERNGVTGWFPVWHQPWKLERVAAELVERSLLDTTGDWSDHAALVAAHYSAGLNEVWMGLRQRL